MPTVLDTPTIPQPDFLSSTLYYLTEDREQRRLANKATAYLQAVTHSKERTDRHLQTIGLAHFQQLRRPTVERDADLLAKLGRLLVELGALHDNDIANYLASKLNQGSLKHHHLTRYPTLKINDDGSIFVGDSWVILAEDGGYRACEL